MATQIPHKTSRLPALRVALLAGGNSAERAVSLESGRAVHEALLRRGHSVVPIDPAATDLEKIDRTDFDVAFLALHGTHGEDGRVQRILETARIPFTGSDSLTSRLAFSKSASKEHFSYSDVPTLPFVLIHQTDDASRIQQQTSAIGFPCVIKPDAQGSSVGVSIVRSPEELPGALTCCFEHDAFGIVEPFIEGTEWTVSMIDDLALPPIQIVPGRTFYDYQAKYETENTRYLFDTDETAETVAAILDAGKRACQSLGTRGLVRADIMLDRFRRPWVLEVNTIPGMTSHSLLPKAAARAGIDFDTLCERALESALSCAETNVWEHRRSA
ncbi:MAG: D-alanine--D-alanine ligase [Planctomycetaceae bacterium]